MTKGLISIIIPSRNEKYLAKTIQDLLSKAKKVNNIEIIAVLDGYWPTSSDFVHDPHVHYIHFSTPKGMRNAINAGVSLSKGEFILKTDAHCMFAQGYDETLKDDCGNDWVVVPRRYALDPEKWERTDNPKYPVDYMYLSNELHGVIWEEKNKDLELKGILIDDLMSSQGSCWFMKRSYYDFLELMDEENYGKFAQEFQEIGLKAWLSGGRVVVNKKTWYAHWHKEVGRGYSLEKSEVQKAEEYTRRWMVNGGKTWDRQTLPFHWILKKFWPVPTWPLSTI